jgi:hypothetical protein
MNSPSDLFLRRSVLAVSLALGGFSTHASAQTHGLDPADLRAVNVEVSAATYRGRSATRVIERQATPPVASGEAIAILPGPEFINGVIEVERGRAPGARGGRGRARLRGPRL